jgi:hypothetical protein
MLASVVAQAGSLFELRDGALRPTLDIMHPRDPCVEMDALTWLADLRTLPT